MKIPNLKFWAICFAALIFIPARAQKTLVFSDPLKHYNQALELFDKEKFGPAKTEFERFIELNPQEPILTSALFYRSICALEMKNYQAEIELSLLLEKNPEHIKANFARFRLGKYYYQNKKYPKAIEQYKEVDSEALTQEERKDYWFNIGHSYFETEKYPEAKGYLSRTSKNKDKYFYPSNYYLGYIVMLENDLDAALNYFNNVQSSKVYGPIIPLYIVRIYYAKNNYDKVIDYTDTVKNIKDKKEVYWIRGQAFYQLKNFKESWPLLDENRPEQSRISSEDRYMIGNAAYQAGKYENAYQEFTQITQKQDSVIQYAYYSAADCFIKLNKKPNARNAFSQAASYDFNKKIKEKSLFNFAQLSFELDFQSDAINSIQKFLEQFPGSELEDDAKTLLGEILLSTRNYKDAIHVLEGIKKKNEQTKKVYQQIAYYRGQELFIDQKSDSAQKYFEKAKMYPIDQEIEASCDFFIAEIQYRKGNYDQAIKFLEKFQGNAKAKETPYFASSLYSLGYAYFRKDNFVKAGNAFNEYSKKDNYFGASKERYIDAMARLGDCNFMQKKYEAAVDAYTYVITKNASNSDYAYFQIGMIRGLQENELQKILTLKKIPQNYPNSLYVDDALFEIALVQLEIGDYNEALRGFSYILADYPGSEFAKTCYLKIGLLKYRKEDIEGSIAAFKSVIEKFPKTRETDEAINVLETIYKEQGRVDEYFDYMSAQGGRFTKSYQDSLSYSSAFDRYTGGNCESSIKDFANYINKFPNGYFRVQAHYYKAECEYALKKYDEALADYLVVIQSGRSEFLERSYRFSANVYFFKKDFENAYKNYNKLESYAQSKENLLASLIGQMRSSYKIPDVEKCLEASIKTLKNGNASKEALIEANYYSAKILVDKKDFKQANPYILEVKKLTTNEMAAECQYYLALAYFNEGKIRECQEEIFKLKDDYPAYEYWVAKGFILLSESYVYQKDYFQARATLESILENYEGDDDIKPICEQRLKEIIALEKDSKK